jgi:hypothetical protein
MNEDELVNLTGVQLEGDESNDLRALSGAASLFLKCGVAVVAVTRGRQGCFIKCNDEERFATSKMLPSTWIGKQVAVDAALLSPETEINSNGAGDSFTCGLLVAALLRHTGLDMMIESQSPEKISPVKGRAMDYDTSIDSLDDLTVESESSSTKKMTPYSLYMKEKYVALKAQCAEDKKAIFVRCHELWEQESDEVKQMYERRCKEELESLKPAPNTPTAKDVTISCTPDNAIQDMPSRNLHLSNQPMNLETAAQFASLLAAKHIDMSTRDKQHLNINRIREQSTASPHGLEEI